MLLPKGLRCPSLTAVLAGVLYAIQRLNLGRETVKINLSTIIVIGVGVPYETIGLVAKSLYRSALAKDDSRHRVLSMADFLYDAVEYQVAQNKHSTWYTVSGCFPSNQYLVTG